MSNATGQKRVFLFLQGPHGPFFSKLGKMLRKTGAEVWRVGFNAGDRAFPSGDALYSGLSSTPGAPAFSSGESLNAGECLNAGLHSTD